jgi:integrase
MARSINRLSDRAVRAKNGKGLYPDGSGLYLQVSSSGSKSWVFRFRHQGKRRDMGLGSLRDVSLAEARKKAAQARRQHQAGTDPIQDRTAQAAQKQLATARAQTFRAAAEAYITAHARSWKSLQHREQWKRTLAAYVFPFIGDLPVAEIGTQHVRAVLEPIWATRPETASRVRGRIEAIINAARADDDSRWSNPALWDRHKHYFPKVAKVAPTRHHPSLPYKEIPTFMADLRARAGVTMRALEFLVLTACRSGEVRGARWDEVDLKKRLWQIPGHRMKAGKPHTVVLSHRAVAILREMAETRTSDLVFPGMRHGEPLHMRTLLMALSEMREGVTVHGFRGTFKTWAIETTNFPDHVSEAALAHTSADKVRAAYTHGELIAMRRRLMAAWERYCSKAGRRKRMESAQQQLVAAAKIRARAAPRAAFG